MNLSSNGSVDLRWFEIKNTAETRLYSRSVVWVKQLHVAVEVIAEPLKRRFSEGLDFILYIQISN